jgi:hypothetical protein
VNGLSFILAARDADPFLDGVSVERKGFFGAFSHTLQTENSNPGKRIEGDGFCGTFFGAFATWRVEPLGEQ